MKTDRKLKLIASIEQAHLKEFGVRPIRVEVLSATEANTYQPGVMTCWVLRERRKPLPCWAFHRPGIENAA